MVSVGNKQVRKAKKDSWYEHGQNCAEYLELTFGSDPKKRAQNPSLITATGCVSGVTLSSGAKPRPSAGWAPNTSK